jgi:hypothetical protein
MRLSGNLKLGSEAFRANESIGEVEAEKDGHAAAEDIVEGHRIPPQSLSQALA